MYMKYSKKVSSFRIFVFGMLFLVIISLFAIFALVVLKIQLANEEKDVVRKTDQFIKDSRSIHSLETASLTVDNTVKITAGFDLSKLGDEISYDTGWVSLVRKNNFIEIDLPRPKILTVSIGKEVVTNPELIKTTTKKACEEGIFDTANRNVKEYFTAILERLKYSEILVQVAKVKC